MQVFFNSGFFSVVTVDILDHIVCGGGLSYALWGVHRNPDLYWALNVSQPHKVLDITAGEKNHPQLETEFEFNHHRFWYTSNGENISDC